MAPQALFPLKDTLVLTCASAGSLLSGFFDQTLMAQMGTGVQASFGLASRPPSFLALAVFGAGMNGVRFTAADSLKVTAALPYAVLAYLAYPACAVLTRTLAVDAGKTGLLGSAIAFLTVKVTVGLATYQSLGLGCVALSSLLASVAQCAVVVWTFFHRHKD